LTDIARKRIILFGKRRLALWPENRRDISSGRRPAIGLPELAVKHGQRSDASRHHVVNSLLDGNQL
jgi:hypothetical protein